ncbi:extracellular solute-binding protein [Halanaerobacter jeridensis]|uniref:Maltodextrin-binding protein n=1 Tax=Halanaerobacter jeridensis TaxID=706427 RepID=A0A939BPL7_9FIRM|nr:extracellular solute-binding protein [Halanaerobacter jeridensis]MBM7557227.1 maltose-binding protein MalE [Halanaerobacter jeridensis]
MEENFSKTVILILVFSLLSFGFGFATKGCMSNDKAQKVIQDLSKHVESIDMPKDEQRDVIDSKNDKEVVQNEKEAKQEQQVEEKETQEQNVKTAGAGYDLKEVKKSLKIKFWEKHPPSIDETLDEYIDKFEAKYPNVNIERTHMGVEDLRESTLTGYMGGAGPDVILSPFDHIGPFSEMGIAQSIGDLMSSEMKNMYLDNALPGMTLNNKVYGVPDTMGNHLTLLYNKNIVNKVPNTWEELVSIAKDKTEDSNGDGTPEQYGLVYNLNEPFNWMPFYTGYGGWMFDKNYNPTLNNEAAKDALTFVHDLKFEHKIVPKECGYSLADSLFKQGKAAFIINGDWSFSSYVEAEAVDLGIARLPKFQKSGEFAHPLTSGSGYIMISERSKEKQIAIMKFIKYMTSQKTQKAMVENHKTLPSNKKVYQLPVIQDDPIMRGSAEQLKVGKPMPIVPEMRAIWDGVRPVLESVMAGNLDPTKAPAKMQQNAEEKMESIK